MPSVRHDAPRIRLGFLPVLAATVLPLVDVDSPPTVWHIVVDDLQEGDESDHTGRQHKRPVLGVFTAC